MRWLLMGTPQGKALSSMLVSMPVSLGQVLECGYLMCERRRRIKAFIGAEKWAVQHICREMDTVPLSFTSGMSR